MSQDFGTAGLDLPHLYEQDKLRRVLSKALTSRLGNKTLSPEPTNYQYWNCDRFGLEKVKVFHDANEDEQAAILKLANCGLLEEAYFIEKAGVGYMAKMVLLAETTEERMLYALFSSDEATHLAQLSCFLSTQEPVWTNDPFLRLLAELIESGDKTVLLFVIQVVLEGWGLSHYKSLASDCQDQQLGRIFQGFLQDEARHHGTGLTLFSQIPVSVSSRATIVETLAIFLQMVQAGPQRLVAAIETVKGHLSRQQKMRIFEELDTQTHSGTRLNLLRSLMWGAGGRIVQELEERGAFQPFPAEKCI